MADNYDDLLRKIHYGEEGSLNLSFDDCITLQKILLKEGYAVMITDGAIANKYNISWVYAGDSHNLKYANRNNVVFSVIDYLDALQINFPPIYDDEESD